MVIALGPGVAVIPVELKHIRGCSNRCSDVFTKQAKGRRQTSFQIPKYLLSRVLTSDEHVEPREAIKILQLDRIASSCLESWTKKKRQNKDKKEIYMFISDERPAKMTEAPKPKRRSSVKCKR